MGNFITQYASPIDLKFINAIKAKQDISICGRNSRANYNSTTQNYEINQDDSIILTINCKNYRLVEYHFHIPSSHTIEGKQYDAEIHYVFVRTNKNICNYNFDLCGSCHEDIEVDEDDSLLVLAQLIKNDVTKRYDLGKMQPFIPCQLYNYSGSLITDDFTIPVKWIIDLCPIEMNVQLINRVAKDSRDI